MSRCRGQHDVYIEILLNQVKKKNSFGLRISFTRATWIHGNRESFGFSLFQPIGTFVLWTQADLGVQVVVFQGVYRLSIQQNQPMLWLVEVFQQTHAGALPPT